MKTAKACSLMLTWYFITTVRPHPLGQISDSYQTADEGVERHRRVVAGIRAGILQLFDGASEIPNVISKGFARTFVKSGNQNKAIKDFYATQPTYIQTYYFPFGGKALEGRLGENTIFLRTRDISERNRPTIRIVNTGSNEMMRKLIYDPWTNVKNDKYIFNQGSLFQR